MLFITLGKTFSFGKNAQSLRQKHGYKQDEVPDTYETIYSS